MYDNQKKVARQSKNRLSGLGRLRLPLSLSSDQAKTRERGFLVRLAKILAPNFLLTMLGLAFADTAPLVCKGAAEEAMFTLYALSKYVL